MSDGPTDTAKLFGDPLLLTARYAIPDHALAAAALLRRFADRLERGESGFDMGEELMLTARVIARRT